MTALPMIRLSGDTLITTSLIIAEQFQKKHSHVLRDIENLDCSKEFSQSNFGLSDFKTERGKTYPMFEITKNGFMFLVMGYTGAKAAQWKERFIAEFDRMADMLNRKPSQFGKRGLVTVTRKLEREIFELFVSGLSKSQIHQALNVSPATVSQILNAKYQFSFNAGMPECSQALIQAVAMRHFSIEQQQDANIAEKRAQRFLNGNNNHVLASELDKLGRNLIAQHTRPSKAQYMAWAEEDAAEGDHEGAMRNRAAAAAIGGE